MKTRIILAVVLILTLIATMASAQLNTKGKNVKPGNDAGIAAMAGGIEAEWFKSPKFLNLSEDQLKQIAEIRQNLHKEIADIIQNTQPGEDRQAKIKAATQAAVDKVLNILTAEQRDMALRLIITRQLLLPPQGPGMGIGKGMGFWNLITPEQKQAIRAIIQEARQEIMQVRRNNYLTPAQKKEQIAAIKKVALDKIMAILSPEQKDQMKTEGINPQSFLQGIDAIEQGNGQGKARPKVQRQGLGQDKGIRGAQRAPVGNM